MQAVLNKIILISSPSNFNSALSEIETGTQALNNCNLEGNLGFLDRSVKVFGFNFRASISER